MAGLHKLQFAFPADCLYFLSTVLGVSMMHTSFTGNHSNPLVWFCKLGDTDVYMLLQEVKRESAQRHAEGADLRNALREAQGRGGPPQALVSLQAELANLRFSTFLCLLGRPVHRVFAVSSGPNRIPQSGRD